MNKQTILKNFSIGFIPLLIFIIADELYGTKIGLIIAIAVGVIEFAYYYLRYKTIEKFILFDVILIVILGGISLILENDIFFKLKPALIEGILVILLAVHAFSNKPILLILGKRYLKDMSIDQTQMRMMRQLTRILFFLFLSHTLLIIYSANYMSKEAWAFISGGLFYIIFVFILLGQFVYMRFIKNKKVSYQVKEGEEWFDLVNEAGQIVGKAPRSAVHGNPDLMHPVVHVHIFNKNGQLYLQKRSKMKAVQPGKWDTAVGGHVNSGEDVIIALKRESFEELGIKSDNFQPLYRYVMRNDFESELVHTFRLSHNGPFKINRDEIDFGRFWRLSEIEKNIGKGIFTPNFEQEFKMLEALRAKQNSVKKIKRK
jgi:isopentenyldiphosphate isomerase/intracellular septation protein A